jgi:hypothetical protein
MDLNAQGALVVGAAVGAGAMGLGSAVRADEPNTSVIADGEVVPHSHVLLTNKTPDKNPLIFSGTANTQVSCLKGAD